jgi:hypothetical protein
MRVVLDVVVVVGSQVDGALLKHLKRASPARPPSLSVKITGCAA